MHGGDDLLEVMEGFVDGQTTTGDKVLEQLPPSDIFYNEVSMSGVRQVESGASTGMAYRSFDVS
jgi:hypothetical protein